MFDSGKKGIIIYYVMGIVHLRNLDCIAAAMPDWTFRVIYEPGGVLGNSVLNKLPFEKVGFKNDKVPREALSGDVRAVIFSAVQLRPAPFNLLKWGLEHKIPTIAIEESNQMAMNKFLNQSHQNYIFPTDHVLAASVFERSGLIEAGVPEHRIRVTGWPYYQGQVEISPQERRKAKQRLGLNPDKPVAALTLTNLGDADETPEARRRQLELAAQGLPVSYQLVIKPHPLERLETLQPFLNRFAPKARVIDKSIPVKELLRAADILLNRGVSQVTIEALHQELPVIILDTGIRTPYHGLADDLIVHDPKEIPVVLKRLESEPDRMKPYADFLKLHVPYSPSKALRQTCREITKIATEGALDTDPGQQWLELILYLAFRLDRRSARKMLSSPRLEGKPDLRAAMKDLLNYRASRAQLEELNRWAGDAFGSQALRCLWIDQLYYGHERITDSDLEWMRDFPSAANITYLFHHLFLWIDLLFKINKGQSARKLARKMNRVYGFDAIIARMYKGITQYDKGWSGRFQYKSRLMRERIWFNIRQIPLLWPLIEKMIRIIK